MRTAIAVISVLVISGCAGGGGGGGTGGTGGTIVHTEPYCPTPAELTAAPPSATFNRDGTVLSHVDLESNPAGCAGPGPFGQGLEPGEDWHYSLKRMGMVNVPVGSGFVRCPDGVEEGGCLMSVSFTPTATSCTYVWTFRYCGYTDVGICCEQITAEIVNPLVQPADGGQ
jgi:hypothetical protein